ncbi:cytochrome bc1 complex diheme cytochrome c subunit [Arsenicicoccus sp. oral taxon 190]|uniref:cytochrome bc1 complex diheme cytochrome c subunit n=1 Tax=Arsenicicoccus sp. oral taxon 190 TaxID=1658671 RepID=UPI00067A4372|nr:c-type cytochrome [Arsenicicoccus sp. oral taxon 190]AKT52056.1 cystathionine beta-lyase [Arsenicicoccus sp. oral taxon 190]
MNRLAARRRHPATLFVLILAMLLTLGTAYAVARPQGATASATASSAQDVEEGKKLFLANCASCHGLNAEGGPNAPTLAGVGAASVDFQVGTGRMPLAAPGVQAMRKDVQFTDEQIKQMAAYVASLGNGPAIPSEELTNGGGDAAKGGEIYRVNCAMCHNAVGAGGALTRGKFAPTLRGVEGKHIYEAMITGPQSMPVFSDANLSPEAKRDVITFLQHMDREENPGGFSLGALGPVPEGLLAWTLGIGLMILAAIWLGKKAA